ncbi:glycosyl hydrolase family 28-related protein [Fictibacillus gelatini]|uniref:glycosyl hydrolase family 28-related protein n=1 Tax=Fictibacillus gelatini TaxID=225985 RepID=UPI00040F823A|nr:glycosyl hydrolase family 28-related protein [Fictibacillus gelatini]
MKIKKISILSIIIIFVLCLYFLIRIKDKPKNTVSTVQLNSVNVTSFGAKGDGKTDSTENIQKAIDIVNQSGGGTVYFPKGIYLIDAEKSIVIKDNVTLNFSDRTILKVIPNNLEYYAVIKIEDTKNASLIGEVEIIGDRYQHKGTEGEWGFGISILGSQNIYIEGADIKNCWGDGIYIGSTKHRSYSENVTIVNPICDNNRRQGMSVISVKNLKIINPTLINTNGKPPQSGIDFEPNNSNEFLEKILLVNPIINNNRGSGIQIVLNRLSGSNNSVDINILSQTEIRDDMHILGNNKINANITFNGHQL